MNRPRLAPRHGRNTGAITGALAVLAWFGVLLWPSHAAAQPQDIERCADIGLLPGPAFSRLDREGAREVHDLLAQEGCQCGCRMPIAECAWNDDLCDSAKRLVAAAAVAAWSGQRGEALYRTVERARVRSPLGTSDPPRLGSPVQLDLGDAHARGPVGAPITLALFSDLVSEASHAALVLGQSVLGRYPLDVRLVLSYVPTYPGRGRDPVGEALAFASARGLLWSTLERTLRRDHAVSLLGIRDTLRELSGDVVAFDAAMYEGVHAPAVVGLVAQAERLEFATAVPVFFVNSRRYYGPQTMSGLSAVIAADLAASRSAAVASGAAGLKRQTGESPGGGKP